MTCHIKIFFQELNGPRVCEDKANLPTVAMHAKMFHALAVGKLFYPKPANFGKPDRVVKKDCQNCAVAFALERVSLWGFEQCCRLRVRQRRGLAFVRPFFGPGHSMCGIVQHGVFFHTSS